MWNNCAKILSDKSDEELSPYLPELFRWLKDLNWPGAICIYDRLIISEDELFEYEQKYLSPQQKHKTINCGYWHLKI